MQDIIRQIHTLLLRQKQTVSVAESCTGGMISSLLTSRPGASAYFMLGAVVYNNRAKHTVLSIPLSLINRHGAVSKQIADAMALAVRKLAKTDIGIGITGIAGPTGGTSRKPVGTVYIATATHNKTICKKYNFRGSRSDIRNQATLAALALLKGTLPKEPPFLNTTHSGTICSDKSKHEKA
ncbi:MAG: CinA family protein [Candidatus Omnitrophota bacterium]